MKCDVKLVTCSKNKLQTVAKLKTILNCDRATASEYAFKAPCIILSEVEEDFANEVCRALREIGNTVEIIKEAEDIDFLATGKEYVPEIKQEDNYDSAMQHSNTARMSDTGNDRNNLFNLWCSYVDYNNIVNKFAGEIKRKQEDIETLGAEIDDIKKKTEQYRWIKETNGDCLRPKIRKASLLEFPEFEFIKWTFIALAVISFIGMLIIAGVAPEILDDLARDLDMGAGFVVWLGAPVLGVIGTILYIIGYAIYSVIQGIKINRSREAAYRNFDVSSALKEATEFLNNENKHIKIQNEKENAISGIKREITELEQKKRNLPTVRNNIPMPNELKSAEGVALLIQYMDTGRAWTIQEAINLYYQDVKDARKMEELRKQTRYAQEQMLNSRIAAENSRITANAAVRTANAAERTADASERAANASERTANAAASIDWHTSMDYWQKQGRR
ncbi:MAG: hypothetical protein E7415_06295 [Ruminococcaceae bacterium]|nr:hypothetical protein [Oscillospiraceae bacterium]